MSDDLDALLERVKRGDSDTLEEYNRRLDEATEAGLAALRAIPDIDVARIRVAGVPSARRLRYLLFAGEPYEGQGWRDFVAEGADVEGLKTVVLDAGSRWAWYEIVDLATLQVVAEGSTREIRQERCSHPVENRRPPGVVPDKGYVVRPSPWCGLCGKAMSA